ncbi:MAG: LPS export ABC transporter periplasmic protein LptC [Methylovulum sp.]|nr:LPS export ABC transporter periplasmic protein LptC [Methylovulum sp.]
MSLRENSIYWYLAVMAVASWILVNLSGFDEVSRGLPPAHSPDFFSKSYAKWEMNDIGVLKNKLLADKMTHYSDDRTTYLDRPEFFSFSGEPTAPTPDNRPPWVIAAESGLLSADGKDLLLNGKVTIARAGATRLRPMQINTSNLTVKPETSYAETDDWAELVSSSNRTTGTGMKLIFKEPVRLELLSHVQGKYETKQ